MISVHAQGARRHSRRRRKSAVAQLVLLHGESFFTKRVEERTSDSQAISGWRSCVISLIRRPSGEKTLTPSCARLSPLPFCALVALTGCLAILALYYFAQKQAEYPKSVSAALWVRLEKAKERPSIRTGLSRQPNRAFPHSR